MATALFEIINPSDPYTIKSDDWKAVCTATLLLGNGKYGLEEYRGENRTMPIFLLGGAEAWIKEHLGCDVDKLVETANREAIIAALDSILIGSPAERFDFEEALEAIDDPVKKKQVIEKRHDRHRSSMNNIGKRAAAIADNMRSRNANR